MGLRVTDLAGESITFGHATRRFVWRLLFTLPFLIGFLIARFTRRRQALYDLISGTLVVRS
jgi:uncharacterized RDD family membrane protein YckC